MKTSATNEGMRDFWEKKSEIIAYKKISWGKKSFADTLIPLLDGKQVLDIGCGTGTFTLYIASHCESIVGFDSSEKLLEQAKKNKSLNSSDNVKFILGSILDENLNLGRKFDLICGTAIIHEFPASDYDAIIKFIKNHLARNGFCIFQENSFFNPLFRFVRNKMLGRFGLRKVGSEFETPFDAARLDLLQRKFKYVSRVCDTFVLFDRFYYQFVHYRLVKRFSTLTKILGKLATGTDQLVSKLLGNSSFTRYWSYINTVYISDSVSYEDSFANK